MDVDQLKATACLMTNDFMFSEPYASTNFKPFCLKIDASDATTGLYEASYSTCKNADLYFSGRSGSPRYEKFCKLMLGLPKTSVGANPFEFVRSQAKHDLIRKGFSTSVSADSWNDGHSLRERVEAAPVPDKENGDASKMCTHAAVNVYVLACLSVSRDAAANALEPEAAADVETEAGERTKLFSTYLQCFGFYESVEMAVASGLREGGRRVTLTKRPDLEKKGWLFASWFAFESMRLVLAERYGDKTPMVFKTDDRLFDLSPDYDKNRPCVLGKKIPLSAERDRPDDLKGKTKRSKIVRRACRDLLDPSFCMGCTLTFEVYSQLLTGQDLHYKPDDVEPLDVDGKTLVAKKTKK